jgi:hypothetical protein
VNIALMTNNIISVWLVLSTNWIPLTVQVPNGTGGSIPKQMEIGIIETNKFANVVIDGVTNSIFIGQDNNFGSYNLIRSKSMAIAHFKSYDYYTNIIVSNGMYWPN